ncbi:MAG TPA: hypothetical protein VG389_23720 [Myxococcota bacterium]|jgi:hypothetical protein|nr:hypothetical protein [Myxococcota bacterium]
MSGGVSTSIPARDPAIDSGLAPLTLPRGPFGARTLRLVRALCAALFDRGGGVPAERLDWVEREINDFLGAAGFVPRLMVWMALLAVQWLPLLVIGRPARFVSLAPAEQRRCLVKMEANRFAVLALPVMAVKIVIGCVYFEHPDARPETGYDGGCLKGTI